MNTREQAVEAKALFTSFISAIDTEIVTEDAKTVLLENPTQWHRLMEQTLLDESKLLEDKDAQPMFRRIFTNSHEKISTKIALKGFVNWLKEEGIQLDAVKQQIVLVPPPGKDRYDVLDTFADKFTW